MPNPPIHIGTSGWNYPEKGAGWRGVFYPPKVDELEFYSQHFDTVEVNTSFYGPPAAKTSEAWVKRTPSHFRFSMKLWQKFTHPKMFEEASGEKSVIASADYKLFREGLDPILQAGKLGCLLMQFPPSFQAKEGSLERLERYLVQFRDCPLAVELRHRSWGEVADCLKNTFASLNVSWAFIDEPKFSSSIRQEVEPTGDTLYVRFHGRNAAKWWKHNEAWERYDYLYQGQELLPFSAEFQRLIQKDLVKRIYVYFNNHARAQAVANAIMLKLQLGLPIETAVPDNLREAFPELKALQPNIAPSRSHRPDRQGKLPL